MKAYTLVFSIFLIVNSAFSQEPTIEWQNTIGGSGADDCDSMHPTSDGGYIIGGKSISNMSGDKSENRIGEFDYWVVKLSSSGSIEWENTIGGSSIDELKVVKQTIDGGYIVGGYSSSDASGDKTENALDNSTSTINDYWVVKLDSNGIVQWDNTIGGIDEDRLWDILVLQDGTFIIGGFSNSDANGDKNEASNGQLDYWVLKLDSLGNILWQNSIGGSSSDAIISMDITNDGGAILGGSSSSNISGDKTENSKGGSDYWIVKITSNGLVEWDKTIGGADDDTLYSVKQTLDGGYVLGGTSLSNASGDKTENSIGGEDYWVVKTDSIGNIEWENTIGGSLPEFNCYVIPTDDNQYLVIGSTPSGVSGDKDEPSEGSFDYWILKLSETGSIVWQEAYGGSSGDLNFGAKFGQGDNDILLGGTSNSGISGDKTENNVGSTDFWVLKLTNVLRVESFDQSLELNIYPNPVDGQFTIDVQQNRIDKIAIYSIEGKLIKHVPAINQSSQTIDVSKLSSGVYFIELTSEGRKITKKFIKK